MGIEGFWGSGTWEGETSHDSQNFDTTFDVKWSHSMAWSWPRPGTGHENEPPTWFVILGMILVFLTTLIGYGP